MSDDKPNWRKVDEHTVMPEAALRSRESLIKLREVFEGLIQADQHKVRILREQLHRSKHGGGS
jgi:hypothetical protein